MNWVSGYLLQQSPQISVVFAVACVVAHEDGVAMLKDVDHDESAAIAIKEWASIPEPLFQISRCPAKGQNVDFPKQATSED